MCSSWEGSGVDKAFVKGLKVLESLAGSASPRGASEIGRQHGLTRSNVHRLLQTLVLSGYAVRDEATGRYSATLKLWELGGRVWAVDPFRRIVAPIAERLAAETDETIHVLFRDGDDLVFVEQIGGHDPLRSHWPLGTRMPLTRVYEDGGGMLAYQKAYVASLADAERLAVIRAFANQLGEPEAFVGRIEEEVAEIRQFGAALHRGEWNPALRGAAAVFSSRPGEATGVIGCAGPAERLPPDRLAVVRRLIADAGRTITREMSGVVGMAV